MPFLLAMLLAPSAVAWKSKPFDCDWDAKEISTFFRDEAGVAVQVRKIEQQMITCAELFDGLLDDNVLLKLGVANEAEMARIKRAVDKLDAEMTMAPTSVWTWRAANRRLADGWLVPLFVYAPRSLLIWLRYYDQDDHVHGGALDRIDNVIDDMECRWTANSTLVFKGLSYVVGLGPLWLSVPSYPLLQAAYDNPIAGLAGALLYTTVFFRTVKEVLNLVVACFTLVALTFVSRRIQAGYSGVAKLALSIVTQAMKQELMGVADAFFAYYVLWYLVPSVIGNTLLNFYIYLHIPFSAVGVIVAAASNARAQLPVELPAAMGGMPHHPPPLDIPDPVVNRDDVPDHFKCPISMEVMKQPTITPTGETFNLPELHRWLAVRGTHPITKRGMHAGQCYPNLSLRALIEEWAKPFSTRAD